MLGRDALKIEARQGYAFIARNFNLVKRYWGWELVWLAYSTATSLAVVFIADGSAMLTGAGNTEQVRYLTVYLLIETLPASNTTNAPNRFAPVKSNSKKAVIVSAMTSVNTRL